MVTPKPGQVILIHFPFSDLSQSKLRPAVILANAGRDDWILCQITSNPYGDPQAVVLNDDDFRSGSLKVTSYARPGKLFTANETLIVTTAGNLKAKKFRDLIDSVTEIIRSGL
jgi:mRNA interferase MazF